MLYRIAKHIQHHNTRITTQLHFPIQHTYSTKPPNNNDNNNDNPKYKP